MELMYIVILLMFGSIVGFMAGLLGIGGGMILVPFLAILFPYFGVPEQWVIHAAIATAMTTIVFTSISSVNAHNKKKAIYWSIVAVMAPGIVIGGFLSGGAAFSYLSGFGLSLFFAVFVSYSGYRMLLGKKTTTTHKMPNNFISFIVGGFIGFISGLVGAGGGFLSVPYMTRGNIAMPNAVATSAALGFFIAVANSIGYIYSGFKAVESVPGMLGYIYWPALLSVAAASVFTAPFGARCAHTWPVDTLRKVFACMLFGISAYMFYKAYVQY